MKRWISRNKRRSPKRSRRLQRAGSSERNLFHQGGLVFLPSGAEAVRIRFERAAGAATAVVVEDGPTTVNAARL